MLQAECPSVEWCPAGVCAEGAECVRLPKRKRQEGRLGWTDICSFTEDRNTTTTEKVPTKNTLFHTCKLIIDKNTHGFQNFPYEFKYCHHPNRPGCVQVQRVVSIPASRPVWWTQTVSFLIFLMYWTSFSLRWNICMTEFFRLPTFICHAASSSYETSSLSSCVWRETSCRLWTVCCQRWTPQPPASRHISSSSTSASLEQPQLPSWQSLSRHSSVTLVPRGSLSKVCHRL